MKNLQTTLTSTFKCLDTKNPAIITFKNGLTIDRNTAKYIKTVSVNQTEDIIVYEQNGTQYGIVWADVQTDKSEDNGYAIVGVCEI